MANFKFLPWIYLAYNFTKEKYHCTEVPSKEFIFHLVFLKSPDYFFSHIKIPKSITLKSVSSFNVTGGSVVEENCLPLIQERLGGSFAKLTEHFVLSGKSLLLLPPNSAQRLLQAGNNLLLFLQPFLLLLVFFLWTGNELFWATSCGTVYKPRHSPKEEEHLGFSCAEKTVEEGYRYFSKLFLENSA